MGGSGGGGESSFSGSRRRDLERDLTQARNANLAAQFGTQLNTRLRELLAGYNSRDAGLVQKKLEELLRLVGRSVDGDVALRFGGSVAKHTFVDGISDVDVLFLMDESELSGATPQAAVTAILNSLSNKLGKAVQVGRGKISVKVQYPDGLELQILPALRAGQGLRVPAWSGDRWSEIEPRGFARALTRCNAAHNAMVVPVIKLAKAVNVTLPEALQLSGYHIESLAIDAFRGYHGERTPSRMLMHLFLHASTAVLSPVGDRSGQSVHVDDYLGPPNSALRQQASHLLTRLVRRMDNANAAASLAQWEALFEV